MNEHGRAELRRLARRLVEVSEGIRRVSNTGAGSNPNLARALTLMEQAEGLILEEAN